MTEREIVKTVEEQEKALRFSSVTFKELRDISLLICNEIEKKGKSAYVETIVNGVRVFSALLDGASINNTEWARRKANLCHRYSTSSERAYLNMKLNGKTLDGCGMSSLDYGLSGGSFPIILNSGVCIGSITVSGMTETEDHQVIVDVLSKHFGLSVPSIE